LSGNKEMLEKIDLFDNAIIDGHSTGISAKELCAYRSVGVMTNHECTSIEEVLEHLRLGMYVQIREGSGARNLESIVKGMLERGQSFDHCLFCTDDKHLEDIRQEGHISYNIRKAIQCGLDSIEAIRMATLNPAQCYKLKRLGAIAPGYSADMLLLSDLENFTVEKVLFRGKVISERGSKPYIDVSVQDRNVFNTVRIQPVTAEDLKIKIKGCEPHKAEVNESCKSEIAKSLRAGINEPCEIGVITVIPNQLITKKEMVKVQTDKEGFLILDSILDHDNIILDNDSKLNVNNNLNPNSRLNKVAVIERHKATGCIGLGIVKGFGIRGGALASTVAHDSHNLIVVGDNDEDMLAAIDELKRVNGGMTVVSDGKVLGTLPLPIAGLMSDHDSDWVEKKLASMMQSVRELGVREGVDPFITMSFLALPVIPEIRVTDRGLFDVSRFEFINITYRRE
ncbi:MAG TPA: adenine deaminase C-terminal domain-containing protein, partial [Clostridiales bacterium]|nr:adenine deaminase C-terminal domain-containing protein [Clostridiales bacterium]